MDSLENAGARAAPRDLLDLLDVEAKQQDVPVLDHVVPPLRAHQTQLARRLVGPGPHELLERDGFGPDEAALEVGVDLARRFEGGLAAVHRPGAHFVVAHGEERLQPEQVIARVDQRSSPGSVTPACARNSRRSSPESSASSASNRAEKRTISASSWCACTAARSASSHLPPPCARSSSFTFAAYRIGFAVSRPSRRRNRTASSPSPASRAPRPAFSSSTTRSSRTSSACASLSPARAVLRAFSRRRSTTARSASASSLVTTSWSRTGSTGPMTCTTSGSSKQRITCTTASTSRMWERNWLPSPSPWEAPFTSPAMSTNSTTAGTFFLGWTSWNSRSSRGSGTATTPTFGSTVQKG